MYWGPALFAQCLTPISSFPYQENFETSNGNWTTGGMSSDWQWGVPSKTIINAAGSGTKCWITGNLTGNSYNGGERSWLQSPCFDFTSISHPFISFRIYWETEFQYDGGNLQYSLNGGTTWINVGSSNDTVDCMNANWFNNNFITNLSTLTGIREGWSGTTLPTSGSCLGGGGSGGWVIASHCLPYLAGQPTVQFRFTFGAGTACNNYDGIAIDDILIEQAPVVAPVFGYACISSNAISFYDSSTFCPRTWNWNFDDPSSGSNSSNQQNPSHVFSAPGNYDVTLVVTNACGASSTVIHPVSIMNATVNVVQVSCSGGNNGSAALTVNGGNSPYVFQWNTSPPQSGITASSLSQGTYNCIVSANNTCPDTVSAVVTEPLPVTFQSTVVPAHCGLNNGTAALVASGGTGTLQYAWSTGQSSAGLSNLSAGFYFFSISDANGCSVSDTVTILQLTPLSTFINKRDATCGQPNGLISVIANGGNLPYAYSWSPPVGTNNSAVNLGSGIYQVITTDLMGCTVTDTASIIQQAGVLFSNMVAPDTCSRGVGSIETDVYSGAAPFSYSWNPGAFTSPGISNIQSGSYQLVVTDAGGCSNDTIIIVSDAGHFQLNLGKDTSICPGNEFEINASPYEKFEWSNGSDEPSILVTMPGSYWCNVTSAEGCSSSDTIVLIEDCLDDLLFPNAFSPNGDGKNDFFFGSGLNVSSFSLQIYNRWGIKVYESNSFNEKWDGTYAQKPLNEDVYVWLLNFEIGERGSREKSGRVLLIR